MDKYLLYKIAYRKLDKITPLKMDCGRLCRHACCAGDADTGMYLFQGEEVMIDDNPAFTMKASSFISGTRPVMLAVCNGTCNRKERPLSCRLFPLVPYFRKNGGLTVILDPRARQVCPLAQYLDMKDFDRCFIKEALGVARLLCRDKEARNFINNLSRMLDEMLL